MATRDGRKIKISTADLAHAFSCSPKYLPKLVAKGIIPASDKYGRYLMVEACRAYVEYQRKLRRDYGDENESGEKKVQREADHRRRLMAAKADLAEIDAHERRGEVVEVAHVTEVWCDIVANFRARTLAIPHKAAPLVAVEEDTDACHGVIEGLVHEALEELSNVEVIDRGHATRDELLRGREDDQTPAETHD